MLINVVQKPLSDLICLCLDNYDLQNFYVCNFGYGISILYKLAFGSSIKSCCRSAQPVATWNEQIYSKNFTDGNISIGNAILFQAQHFQFKANIRAPKLA